TGVLLVWQERKIGNLTDELKAAVASATVNAAVAKYEREENLRILAATAKAAVVRSKLQIFTDADRRTIIDAPQADDGALAPVLRRDLEPLPEFPASSTPSSPSATHSR